MTMPPALVYWVECREPSCIFATNSHGDPAAALRELDGHAAVHPGKTTRTILHADSLAWVVIGAVHRGPRQAQLFQTDGANDAGTLCYDGEPLETDEDAPDDGGHALPADQDQPNRGAGS